MFIRRTQTRTAPTGETCFTHRLVRSERIASKVRQRTLLNLGRHFETKPEDWPALCRRIDELLCGQLAMHHDVPPALESQAQRITAQLLARERAGEREPVRAHDWQPVDVDSLELVRPRSVGVERAEPRASPRPNAGHSKDKRTDCPLLTLGLVLDASGFVRRSQVFAGNVTEHRTLAQMLDALNAPCDALVVMDRGIATEECVRWLRENAYRYLVVSRERTRYFDPERAQRIETASRHGVHLHKSVSEDGQEVRLHCFSEERANKERAIVERFAGRFEHALTQLNEGLSRPRTHKRTHKLRERIARLKAKSRGIAQHYHIRHRHRRDRPSAPPPYASPARRSMAR